MEILANSRWIFYVILPTFLVIFTICKRYKRSCKYSIKDKTILITGACNEGGLGYSLALLALLRGAKKVIVTSRNDEQLNSIQSNLLTSTQSSSSSSTSNVFPYKLDLCDCYEEIDKIIDEIWQNHGPIDIVINNAGCSYRGIAANTQMKVFQQLMDSNFNGHVALTQRILHHHLLNQTKNSNRKLIIVGISSLQGLIPLPYRSAYAASKHAFQAYHNCLKWECFVEPINNSVHVLTVSPAYIRTQLSMHALRDNGETHARMDNTTANGMLPSYVAKEIVNAIELQLFDLQLFSNFTQKAAVYINTLSPALFQWLMIKRAKKEKPY